MQNHYNLVYREEEREMLPLCEQQGIAVIPWSPLARGLLAGSRKSAGRGLPPSEVALAWLCSKRVVTAPIVGATKMPHLESALHAMDVTLDEQEIEQLEAPYLPHAPRGYD